MSSSLVIFAGPEPAAPVEWRLVRASGAIDGAGMAQLDDLTGSGADRCVLILPGELVTAHDTHLVARSERQLLAAAPFAVEDQVASDLDAVHVAISPVRRDASESGRVAYVVDGACLDDWIGALERTGPRPSAVVPDYLTLPVQPGRILLAELAESALLRDVDWGAGVDRALGPQVLNSLIEMRVGDGEKQVIAEDLTADEWRDRMAANAADLKGGLLQGRYAVRRESASGENAGRWMPAGLLAAAAALSLVALNLVEGIRLQGAARSIEAETTNVFRAAFPEVERVVNPRAQLRALTRDSNGGSPDFLVLSAFIAEAGDAVPALEVSSLRYDGQNREMNVSVLFRSYDDLARFRNVIEAAGGVVEEGGSRQQGNRRAGDIVVRRS